MSLATDLLEQAEHLCRREPRRPRQASLRRSISAAYYALFHLLVEEASAGVVAGDATRRGLRPLVGRAYDHGEMRKVCSVWASGGTLPLSVRDHITFPVSADLRLVAETFLQMQSFRHTSDYDTGRDFGRSETDIFIGQVRAAFAAWGRVRGTADARTFLLALLLWNRWTR